MGEITANEADSSCRRHLSLYSNLIPFSIDLQ